MYAGQCHNLLPLSNGNISYSFDGYPLRPYGTVATHTCNQGYYLSGDKNRTCNNSEWLGTMPTCIGMANYCIIYLSPAWVIRTKPPITSYNYQNKEANDALANLLQVTKYVPLIMTLFP